MEKCFEEIGSRLPNALIPDRWRRLAVDVLVLAAFVLTSSWLVRQ
jgi:hypothetical protein